MTTNSGNNSGFSFLSYAKVRGIETLEEQRAINSNGVQMICIRKPYPPKETKEEEQPMNSPSEANSRDNKKISE